MIQDANISALWARVIVEEATWAGLAHWCISPGSRSTPLTLAAAAMPGAQVSSHIDEREAGFYALGLARALCRPVALICTSGSAAGHYLPALIEATMSRIPLVVFSADRPFELMGCSSPQTIAQQHLFGHHVKATLHTERPVATSLALRHLRQAIAQVVQNAAGQGVSPPGPVHVNVPFLEPLEPSQGPVGEVLDRVAALGLQGRPYVTWCSPQPGQGWPPEQLALWQVMLGQEEAGVVVCGPMEPRDRGEGWGRAAAAFAQRLGWPLLADPLSGARYGSEATGLVEHYDAILRAKAWAKASAPKIVVSFGAPPTSKAFLLWQQMHPEIHHLIVNPWLAYDSPAQGPATLIQATPTHWIQTMEQALDQAGVRPKAGSSWLTRWMAAEHQAKGLMNQASEQAQGLWEGGIARALVRHLQPGASVHVASSMPVRDLDAYGTQRQAALEVVANRGANGIDGLIATALGQAAGMESGRHWVVIGDVATMHDVGALLHAHRHQASHRLVVVVIDNGGGGIFEYLPIAAYREHFDAHFLTPHHLCWASLAHAAHATHVCVRHQEELVTQIHRLQTQPPQRLVLIEAVVDRALNVALHNEVWARVSQALDQEETHAQGAPHP